MGRILVIDDDADVRKVLADVTAMLTHEPATAATLAGGMELLGQRPFDLVFLDVNLPDGSGLDALSAVRSHPSLPEVIIITGAGAPEGAELAIRGGAWDYIQKPLRPHDIILHVKRAFEYHQRKLMARKPLLLQTDGILGSSIQMRECLETVAQCAASDASVLIAGETGTGKELFARAVHANSLRAEAPFVVVDCAVLPEQLTESVLFGHARGAFTGAVQATEGLVKQADGGTLFLDEVGELPPPHQKSFLRLLQERRYRPVGSTQEVESDFRLIAATNRSLERMVQEGTFRQDLFQRLRTFAIHLPVLRGRAEDIREMALRYIHILCRKHGLDTMGALPEFMQLLMEHDWPGNVRELVHALEKAVLTNRGHQVLYPIHLPESIRVRSAHTRLRAQARAEEDPGANGRLPGGTPQQWPDPLPTLRAARDEAVQQIEESYLQELFRRTAGDLDRASAASGLSKNRLYVLARKLKLAR